MYRVVQNMKIKLLYTGRFKKHETKVSIYIVYPKYNFKFSDPR